MTRAPSRAAVSAKVVSGFASGSRMAVRNMARPAMAACQLFHKLSGRTTRDAPAMASRMRKASQLRRSRRRFRSLGRSNTSAKRAARPKLRSRAAAVSCGEATGVGVVLITVRSGGVYCFSIARRKSKIISWRLGVFETVDFAHAGEGAADVRDGDGATDDQCDVEGVDDLVALPAEVAAAEDFFVEVGTKFLEVVEMVGHGSSEMRLGILN